MVALESLRMTAFRNDWDLQVNWLSAVDIALPRRQMMSDVSQERGMWRRVGSGFLLRYFRSYLIGNHLNRYGTTDLVDIEHTMFPVL